MKTIIVFFLCLVLAASQLPAQVPQAFSYQAIAQDADGELITGQDISVKIGILAGSATGTLLYEETHNTTTNDLGLFSIKIGLGTVTSGSISKVDWGASVKYLEIAIDVNGGSSYTDMGTIQLLSVPYALYSDKSGGDDDNDPANEIQDIALDGTELSISQGSTVDLISLKNDADADPENEIQDLELNGNILKITNNEGATEIDLSPLLDGNSQTLVDVLSQNTSAGGNRISDLADPVDAQDAATKAYVDSYTETDPVYEQSVANGITEADTARWNGIDSLDLTLDGTILNLEGDGTPVFLDQITSPWDRVNQNDSGGEDLQYTNGSVIIGTSDTESSLIVSGVVESQSGGFKFPDGSVQTTASGTTSAEEFNNYFVVTGQEILTQPEFNVAGFNQVIAEANLTKNNPISGSTAANFEPFVLISVRPSAPDPGIVEYQGDIGWELVIKNLPPQELPGGQTTPRSIEYRLQFQLLTQPLPPQPDGSPGYGDLAPAGSEVVVNYRAVFVKFQ